MQKMKLQVLKEKLLRIDLSKFDNFYISKHEKITDANNFIETHISFLERNKGNRTFKPYYDRLLIFINAQNNVG